MFKHSKENLRKLTNTPFFREFRKKLEYLQIFPQNNFERPFRKPVQAYSTIKTGNVAWNELKVPLGDQYTWEADSTYIQSPPFFESMEKTLPAINSISNARVLLNLGDSVTTDHISPAGAISRTSPAAKYLQERNIQPRQFNRFVFQK